MGRKSTIMKSMRMGMKSMGMRMESTIMKRKQMNMSGLPL